MSLIWNSNSLREAFPDSERRSKEHFVTFEEYQIPDTKHRFLRQTVAEERKEPLHGEHIRERRFVAASWKVEDDPITVKRSEIAHP